MSSAKSSLYRFQQMLRFPSNSLFEYLEALISEIIPAVLFELERTVDAAAPVSVSTP